jgi:hypothetical protein
MDPNEINPTVIAQFARCSTAASARLEGRQLPVGYVRSTKVTQLLAQRGDAKHDASVRTGPEDH